MLNNSEEANGPLYNSGMCIFYIAIPQEICDNGSVKGYTEFCIVAVSVLLLSAGKVICR